MAGLSPKSTVQMRSSQQHFVVPILPLLLLSAAVPAAHGVGVEVDASGNVAGGLRAGRIPRVVHYVLADRGARFFDWTMYVSVKAALNVLRADEVKIHLLDGAEPWGGWFAAVRPLVTLVPFAATHRELNGVAVEEPAHIADFRRFEVLAEEGGIYMDTDHVPTRSYDDLLHHTSVWGRQGKNELGNQVAIGCILAEPGAKAVRDLLQRMAAAFDGGWDSHSIKVVDRYMLGEGTPAGARILDHPLMFPFSWLKEDVHEVFFGEGLDLDSVYAVHLFHSQSSHIYRYASSTTVRSSQGNFYRAVRRVFDHDSEGLQAGLLDKMDEYSTSDFTKMRAHARTFGVELEAERD